MIISPITTTDTYSTLCDDDSEENNEKIAKLSKKVEELSKKLIEQNKQITHQNKQIQDLKKQIVDQDNQITQVNNLKQNNSFIKNSESYADKLEREIMEIYSESNIMKGKSVSNITKHDESNITKEKNESNITKDENLETYTNEWKQHSKTNKSVNIEFLKKGTCGDKLIKPEQCIKIESLLINENTLFTEKDLFIIRKAIGFAGTHGFYNPKIDNDKDLHKICTVGAITCLCNILFKTRDETIKFRKQLREHFQWFINDPNAQIDHNLLKSHSLGPYDGETILLKKLYEYMLSEGLNKITDAYCKKPIY